MVRIAPVRLSFNPKTLWFDAGTFELNVGDPVVVSTARGKEFGHVSQAVFDMDYEKTKKLKSPLKPVERIATEEDQAQADEAAELSMQALPVFRQLAADYAPDMNPVAVEYLFSGEKAVFYFDSEERVDFRDLVRKLAAELRVRVDMKQVGVRDGARMVGGLGHCGQELCCARLGGQFNPVSIRMAKEQDLSLNPQKISGVCGRLMCCLRYEFEAYKDFHGRAPKKNARINTPDGEGKVVDLDVPREVVSIKVGDEKPVKVPLADMDAPEGSNRPNSVGEEAWEKAQAPAALGSIDTLNLFTTHLSAEDKLAEPGKATHVHGEDSGKPSRSRHRRRSSGKSSGGESAKDTASSQPRQRKQRRRSTKVASDGSTQVEEKSARSGEQQSKGGQAKISGGSARRRSRNRSHADAGGQQNQQQGRSVQVGRNSSGLRAARSEQASSVDSAPSGTKGSGGGQRRRRRSHKAETGEGSSAE